MNERNHIKRKNITQLTRRQFLGLGIFSVGTGLLCGGMSAGIIAATQNPQPTATHSPTLIPPSPEVIVEKPAMIDRVAWGGLSPNINARNENGYYDALTNREGWYVYPDALKNSYQTVVIHHSGFYEHDGQTTLDEIQRSHREDRGWADVGYHFMIDKDGMIYEGRDITVRGVHVEGYNTGSVGVCLLGDYRSEAPSQAQLNSVYALNDWLVFRLQVTHLTGHGQFNDWTECPGTFVINQLESIASRAGLIFGIDGYVSSAKAGDSCSCCLCEGHI